YRRGLEMAFKPPTLRRMFSGQSDFAKRMVINVLIALVVPILSGFVGNISTIYQVFIGAFVFVIGLLIQVTIELMIIRQERIPSLELWEVQNEADRALTNIRASYSRIASGRNNLYVRYFEQELNELSRSIHEAAASEDLRVDQDSDTT